MRRATERLGFVAAAGLALAGCVTAGDYAARPAADIAAAVQVVDSVFDPQAQVLGPGIRAGLWPNAVYALRGGVDRAARTERHQLYVEVTYDDRAYQDYAFASFAHGAPRRADKIFRERRDCSGGTCVREETVGIDLTPADLAADRDLAVRLEARGGDRVVLVVPRSYLAAYRSVVADVARRLEALPPPPAAEAPVVDAPAAEKGPAYRRRAG
ncbi:hypothetical protein [Mongoliimonas terrestris]|uniref:hypothetical protein n=1 Tax=Mongoliimonas terrestris TaxID=1709001 RepID=UPI00094960FB|nr:hypothetical protein [Mongoliimonas terrestris]